MFSLQSGGQTLLFSSKIQEKEKLEILQVCLDVRCSLLFPAGGHAAEATGCTDTWAEVSRIVSLVSFSVLLHCLSSCRYADRAGTLGCAASESFGSGYQEVSVVRGKKVKEGGREGEADDKERAKG